MLDLFDGWLNAKPTADNLRAYCAEIEPYSLEAVKRSVGQFRGGKVDGHDMAFPPSAAAVARNCAKWQTALDTRNAPRPEQHTGLLNVDFGRGSVNMIGLTEEEQDIVMQRKGINADGSSMAGMSAEAIRQELAVGALAGPAKVVVPRLQRVQQ